MRCLIRTLLPVLLLVASPDSTPAQGSAPARDECTYDSCALRVRHGFWGRSLVRGMQEEKVIRLGWFPGAVPLFAERSDTAAVKYASFRSKQPGGGLLVFVGGIMLSAGLAVHRSNNDWLGVALFGVGSGLALVGIWRGESGLNDLQQAIWWYNRTLPRNE